MRIRFSSRLLAASVAAAIAVGLPSLAHAAERCTLDGHAGVPDADAETAADFVCAEVDKHLALGATQYHVKLGKLGGQVVVSLEAERGGVRQEREQLVLSGIDEIPVAAPRLVDALGQRRPVGETMDVTNVVGGETRIPKKRPSEVHGVLSPVVVVIPALGSSGGARLGLTFGGGRWSFGLDTTLGGYSFTGALNTFGSVFQDSSYGSSKKDLIKNPATGYASVATGARYHFFDSDISPWLGGGVALEYIGYAVGTSSLYGTDLEHASNFGAAAYAELGLDVARTRMFGASLNIRVDAPAFSVGATRVAAPSQGESVTTTQASTYAPVLTFGVGLRL